MRVAYGAIKKRQHKFKMSDKDRKSKRRFTDKKIYIQRHKQSQIGIQKKSYKFDETNRNK